MITDSNCQASGEIDSNNTALIGTNATRGEIESCFKLERDLDNVDDWVEALLEIGKTANILRESWSALDEDYDFKYDRDQ